MAPRRRRPSQARRAREGAAETIAEHFDGIVAYVEVGLTNAITEGLNRKARVVTSRSYGFRRLASFASMLLLCCGGITLPWPHVVPL
ncbi:MAG: transposase [Myxococcales bacterium]|nr:transposase [Myxococcales bacterium]